MDESKSVLVLDANFVPALCVVRSLGRLGLRVDVASDGEKPLAAYSRHAGKKLQYPDPLKDEAGFIAWCGDILTQGGYGLVVPVTERTVAPLMTFGNDLLGRRIAMASPGSLAIALDKSATLTLAAGLGVPVPQWRHIEHPGDIPRDVEKIAMPVVLKPARSIGEAAHARRHVFVNYAIDRAELGGKVEELLRFGPVLLQEYVRGAGVGIELIADRGEVVYAFQHRRLHEVPLTGGGSSFRMSVPIEPELLAASRSLMKALNWHGVAMVEFKWDDDSRRFWLMEINGRLWGSLPLAVAAGADFPAMLYELHTSGKVTPRPEAKVGVLCRKLSSDIAWQELVLRRDAPPQLVTFPSTGAIVRDWLKVFSRHHHFDVQQWRDPLPGLVDLRDILAGHVARIGRLLRNQTLLRRQAAAWRGGRVAAQLRGAQRILFICYGNINRSALAERYLHTINPRSAVAVMSAGFHEPEGREADPMMVEVAGQHGVDMLGWASKTLTREMVESSDVIFVMELTHYDRICSDYPSACGRVWLLGAGTIDLGEGAEIADPYGKPKAAYEGCVRRILKSVQQVAESL